MEFMVILGTIRSPRRTRLVSAKRCRLKQYLINRYAVRNRENATFGPAARSAALPSPHAVSGNIPASAY